MVSSQLIFNLSPDAVRAQYLRTWALILHVLLSVQCKEVIRNLTIYKKGLHVHAVDGVNLHYRNRYNQTGSIFCD